MRSVGPHAAGAEGVSLAVVACCIDVCAIVAAVLVTRRLRVTTIVC